MGTSALSAGVADWAGPDRVGQWILDRQLDDSDLECFQLVSWPYYCLRAHLSSACASRANIPQKGIGHLDEQRSMLAIESISVPV